MQTRPLREFSLSTIRDVMQEGRPWLPEDADYWFFRTLFGSTSFIALADDTPAGGIIACIDQDRPEDLYVDQVAVCSRFRGRRVVHALFAAVEHEAARRGCTRLWLSTDPANPAVHVWPRLGFVNCPGDMVVADLQVVRDFKGPGRHRAIFEKVCGHYDPGSTP